MNVLRSRVDTRADSYKTNREQNLEAVAKLQRLLAKARAGGGDKYVKRHLARGKLLYDDPKKGACLKCHGEFGRGDGPESGTQKDDWGARIDPGDLTKPWPLRPGGRLEDLYRTLSTGINGTPMPGYADTLSEDDRWNIALYSATFAKEPGLWDWFFGPDPKRPHF